VKNLASKNTLETYQGEMFTREVIWKDSNGTVINLTGYTSRMCIRTDINTEPVIDLSSNTNGGIVITPNEGKIVITIKSSQTRLLTGQKYIYDLFLIDSNGNGTVLLYGNINNIISVTAI